ncbi:MAG: alpha-galactosidase [Pseudomonadota bacterium]|nr:alpha-galactosidase [Pseudomonadota bacterium]
MNAIRVSFPALVLCALAACQSSEVPQASAAPTAAPSPGSGAAAVELRIDEERIVLRNGLIERSWTHAPLVRTEALTDLRTGKVWSTDDADFSLSVLGLPLASDNYNLSTVGVQSETTASGSVRLTMSLAPTLLGANLPPNTLITRTFEMYPGIAGMRVETRIETLVPLVISGYTLDQSQPEGDGLNADLHAFRAGADWREPEWAGPPLVVGDAQLGTWRKTTSGTDVTETAEWLSLRDGDDRRLFYVLERNDLPSSVMSFDGGRARAGVDLARDIIYLGPLEEQVHIGNPLGGGVGRTRIVMPGQPLQLESVFTGVGVDGDDEAWQHYKYLSLRMPRYPRAVTFNSNGVDDNVISTGAKDDMDFATFIVQLETAKAIGIETFIFDDGWQARSGDWCPDADVPDEQCTEPRRGSDPKFAPRFPDAEFKAVREQLEPAGMRLGLWMSPLHFHPSSVTFRENPQWLCLPLSAALLLVNQAQPYDSSSEAGIVQWNPEAVSLSGKKAIDHIEERIRIAIESWGVSYFKYDFTAWLDCVGINTVDMYAYRESFMRMLDRVLADHPDVTIQMDETNDYRLFPFEALVRGPTWYQNGSPAPNESLHANWILTPWVPPHALGRAALRSGDIEKYSVDYQMAVALLSHISFFNDLRDVPAEIIPRIRVWMDYYKAHREDLATLTYSLTDEDPYSGYNWAAFQTWNPERARGVLLVYRQDASDSVRTIRLRNVPAGNYRLLEAPAETTALNYSAEQLRAGIQVSIPAIHSARVFRIERLQ